MGFSLQRSVTWSLLASLLPWCGYVRAQDQTARVTKFELKNYGWQPLPDIQRGERLGPPSPLISIDHKGRVLVGFAVRENYSLATREHPGLSFHVLRFTSEGKVDLAVGLPTKDNFNNGLYLGADDQPLARANDSLQVLLENEQSRKDAEDWQPLAPCPWYCSIHQSPSHRTLILRTPDEPYPGTSNSTYTILDTGSSLPRVAQTCSKMAFLGHIVTDRFAYWPGAEGHEHFVRRYRFCDVEHPEELPLGWGTLYALGDDAFLLFGADKDLRGSVKLVSTDGQVRFHHEMAKGVVPLDFPGARAVSDEVGDRFAFIVSTWRGGSRSLDISGKRADRRVVVYSEMGQELAAVPVSMSYHRDFDFCLSPDGHRLAILEDDSLTVFRLD
jgi:hypothetical protein